MDQEIDSVAGSITEAVASINRLFPSHRQSDDAACTHVWQFNGHQKRFSPTHWHVYFTCAKCGDKKYEDMPMCRCTACGAETRDAAETDQDAEDERVKHVQNGNLEACAYRCSSCGHIDVMSWLDE